MSPTSDVYQFFVSAIAAKKKLIADIFDVIFKITSLDINKNSQVKNPDIKSEFQQNPEIEVEIKKKSKDVKSKKTNEIKATSKINIKNNTKPKKNAKSMAS